MWKILIKIPIFWVEKAKKTLHKYKCLLEETNNSSSGVKRYSTENSNHHFKEKIPKACFTITVVFFVAKF